MNKSPLVSIITVNFNGKKITRELINSLSNITYPNIEIIVVDNGSKENIDSLGSEFPHIILIKSENNLGFAGGNNLGIAQAKGKYLMFLNNDTEVDIGFLEPLVEEFENNPTIGVASPKIIYFHLGNKDIIQYAGSHPINKYTIIGTSIGYLKKDSSKFTHISPTHLVHGAAMMVPMSVIKRVGLMPDIYFLYYEEHDWCETIKRAGYLVYYIGTSKVYHKESITVGDNSPLKTYYLNRGRLIFLRRNTFGLSKISSILFFIFLAFPKNALKHLLSGKKKTFTAYILGCLWNLTNRNVKITPFLEESDNGTIKIVDNSTQQLKTF